MSCHVMQTVRCQISEGDVHN